MTDIVIIDTTVLLNLLDVTGRNQNRSESVGEFRELISINAEFLIPLATIFETSNHIKQVKRVGNQIKRRWAEKLRDTVTQTVDGSEFWIGTIRFPDPNEFIEWVDEYPNCSIRGKDLNDLSIIKEWRKMCEIYPNRRVRIWSFDGHLMGYDNNPALSQG